MHFAFLKNKSFLVPTALFVVYTAVMLSLLGTGDRKYAPLWRTLTQWDGAHYATIAQIGYEAFPCPDNPEWICGNVGWFPAYPLLARFVNTLAGPFGVDFRWNVILTSLLTFWIALLLLYRLIALRFDHRAALYSLIALLLFPTSFYFLTAFPYALFLLLSAAVLLLLERERYLAAALPSGLLAVTYPSGAVIALPLLWTLIARWRFLSDRRRLALAASVASVGAALLLYGLYCLIEFDDFLLYVHFQSKPYYAHQAAFPFVPMVNTLLASDLAAPVPLILLFVAATLALFYSRRLPISWQLFLWGILLFTPTAGTTDCYYRHIVVAFPLFAMIGLAVQSKWRRWLLPAYALAAVILMWTVYLSRYKSGSLM